MSIRIESRPIGVYEDENGDRHTVIEYQRISQYRHLNGVSEAPGSLDYKTSEGIELNMMRDDKSLFWMVLEDMELRRVSRD